MVVTIVCNTNSIENLTYLREPKTNYTNTFISNYIKNSYTNVTNDRDINTENNPNNGQNDINNIYYYNNFTSGNIYYINKDSTSDNTISLYATSTTNYDSKTTELFKHDININKNDIANNYINFFDDYINNDSDNHSNNSINDINDYGDEFDLRSSNYINYSDIENYSDVNKSNEQYYYYNGGYDVDDDNNNEDDIGDTDDDITDDHITDDHITNDNITADDTSYENDNNHDNLIGNSTKLYYNSYYQYDEDDDYYNYDGYYLYDDDYDYADDKTEVEELFNKNTNKFNNSRKNTNATGYKSFFKFKFDSEIITLPVLDVEHIVSIHNNFWNENLSIIAKLSASGCRHALTPVKSKLGNKLLQNYAYSTGKVFNLTDFVTEWANGTFNEKDRRMCPKPKICYRYKNMIESSLTLVGCGADYCTKYKNENGESLKDVTHLLCLYAFKNDRNGTKQNYSLNWSVPSCETCSAVYHHCDEDLIESPEDAPTSKDIHIFISILINNNIAVPMRGLSSLHQNCSNPPYVLAKYCPDLQM
ncbi:hypothetical protein HELRODRAFT_175201 [Helobdella robusta]|uniref:Uncharacterized protein n=1 Tax=Helobdella robusta TaxID=6412 RepID=T1F8Z9_HELRO|nr:hypothetical protein HELRODRAFT_175201 [Helobdella robusta]ESO01173.1 hypothetical protein HELRODRAFT_175201 [Helobdella robusta]